MVDYKRILQLRAQGVSQRGIAEALGCSRNTVATVFAAAYEKGVVFDESVDPDDLRRLLLPEPHPKPSERVQPDFPNIHKELARPNVTLLLVWTEYVGNCRTQGLVPYQYSYFCQQYRSWAKVSGAVLRVPREPGRTMEVDWAGDTMVFTDPLSGQPRKAYLFVAVLSYSVYSFVEAFDSMKLDAWIKAHIRAFDFFGGVPRILIPDNLRTGVTRSSRYEPVLNPAYQQLAEHYGVAIMPARVRHPKDKPSAEAGVRHIANRAAAALRDRRFIGLTELNEALAEQIKCLNAKPFDKKEESREIVFRRDEMALLASLPPTRFELVELRKAKVAPNYHIQVAECFYSVPARLIGQSVDVRLTSSLVEVYAGTERVATHPRIKAGKGLYATIADHMPRGHREYLRDWTPKRFMSWAQSIGPATADVIAAILDSKPIIEQSYRSCLGVLSLAKKPGGVSRLEQTCAQALQLSCPLSYTAIKRMWSTWQPPQDHGLPGLGGAGFVRGADYYATR